MKHLVLKMREQQEEAVKLDAERLWGRQYKSASEASWPEALDNLKRERGGVLP